MTGAVTGAEAETGAGIWAGVGAGPVAGAAMIESRTGARGCEEWPPLRAVPREDAPPGELAAAARAAHPRILLWDEASPDADWPDADWPELGWAARARRSAG